MDSTPTNGSSIRARSQKANTSPSRAQNGANGKAKPRSATVPRGQSKRLVATATPAAVSVVPPLETYPAIAIENVEPELEGGHWPIKRVVGDSIRVSAEIFKEGHDLIQARITYQAVGDSEWREETMHSIGNDRWTGEFSVDRNTRHLYSILAFTDTFGSWRADFQKRLAAAQDATSELLEGLRLVEEAAERATDPDDRGRLEAYATRWKSMDYREAAELAISQELGETVDRWPDRSDATRYRRDLELIVDRPAARFAAWYEIYPRSQGTD